MKLMERYGNRIFEYEGTCRGELEIDEDTLPFTGYYEAAQYSSGRFEVGVIVTNRPESGTNSYPNVPTSSKLTFEGRSTEGWSIKPCGRVLFSNLGWVMEIGRLKGTGETLSAPYFETSLGQDSKRFFCKARFLVSNLLWHGMGIRVPAPFVLDIQDFRITIDAIDDYIKVAENLTSRPEVEPTAWITIEAPRETHYPLRRFKDLMDDIMCVLRLVTGNHVNWYYGEGLDNSTAEAVERVHQNTGSSPYSNTVSFSPRRDDTLYLIQKLDIVALTKAFFDESCHVLDKETLKVLVNQFAEAASDRHYLESRGLLVSTLVELIASKYARLRSRTNAISRNRYEKEVYPELESVIGDSGLRQMERDQILLFLVGGYRLNLHEKISLIRDELNIPLTDEAIRNLVNTRNALVHQGTYVSSQSVDNWKNDYNFIVHTVFITLCRLFGYKGELPKLHVFGSIQL